jgi:hypothetical protein
MFGIIIWLVCAVVSGSVGTRKGRTGLGWVLGILLGPIGLIIIAVVPENTERVENTALLSGELKKCPYCAELIKRQANVCRYCGREIT